MRRQIFFITSKSLSAYEYTGGKLECMAKFVAAENNLSYFDDYVQLLGQTHTYVLTDLTEEDFRIETVTHAIGNDRKALLERRATRLYRGTDYRHAEVLGRDPHNRRKDEVLFSGLLNPELADLWLEPMMRHKVPVDGVYSLPLLSARLIKRLCTKSKDVLLVTDNAESGLRQSFFSRGQLRFSRLAPMPELLSDAAYSDFVHAEIGKTKRYLANLHLLNRDVTLEVCMLSGGQRLEELARMSEAKSLTHYQLHDITVVAKRLGYKGPAMGYHSDHLLVHLLAKSSIHNHYANNEHRFHFKISRTRQALALVSVAATVCGVLWTGISVIDGVLSREELAGTAELTNLATAHYNQAVARVPESEVAPEDIHAAVNLAAHLQNTRNIPHTMLSHIGHALQQQSGLALKEIDWFVSDNRNAVSATAEDDGYGELQVDPAMDNNPSGDEEGAGGYRIGIIRGRVSDFNGDYTWAHQQIDWLLTTLRGNHDVLLAEALELPINTDTGGHVQGGVGDASITQEAVFSVRVVMEAEHARL